MLYTLRSAEARGLDASVFYRHIAPLERKMEHLTGGETPPLPIIRGEIGVTVPDCSAPIEQMSRYVLSSADGCRWLAVSPRLNLLVSLATD